MERREGKKTGETKRKRKDREREGGMCVCVCVCTTYVGERNARAHGAIARGSRKGEGRDIRTTGLVISYGSAVTRGAFPSVDLSRFQY